MTWTRYVAVGDSFTEGLDDPRVDSRHRGWADRLADSLAATTPGFHYANLAIRGRKLPQIIDEQLPAALAMQPDLVSLVGGVNDVLRPKWDGDAIADLLEQGVQATREAGADVILVIFGDPSKRSRTLGITAGRLKYFRTVMLEIGDRNDCYVVDLDHEPLFDDQRMWSVDRLHLNAIGHARVAGAALQTLGRGDDSWRDPLPPAVPMTQSEALRDNAEWLKTYLAPWFARRIRGRSSGDAITAKRPDLIPL